MVSFKTMYTMAHRYLNDVFVYELTPMCRIASGMNATLTITFRCTSMEDVYEFVTIVASDDQKTNILVCAENAMPILKCKCTAMYCFFFISIQNVCVRLYFSENNFHIIIIHTLTVIFQSRIQRLSKTVEKI